MRGRLRFTKRRLKKGHKGARSVRSVNVDSEFYHSLLCRAGGAHDVIERICPWLKGAQRRTQRDGARPHASEGEIEDLEAGRDGDGWSRVFVTQPANSPDANFNDFGLFHSTKAVARQAKTRCVCVEETMDNVQNAFELRPKEKITGIWAYYYSNLRSLMKENGGDAEFYMRIKRHTFYVAC